MEKEFRAFLNNALKLNDSTMIVAVYINIYENDQNGYNAEVIGADDFTTENPDWACRGVTSFETHEKPFTFNSENHVAALELIKEWTKNYLENGEYSVFLKSRHCVAVGFAEGDLHAVYIRPKKKAPFLHTLTQELFHSLKQEYRFLEKSYRKELEGCFENDLAARALFISALKDYNRNRFDRVLKKLTKIANDPLTSKERIAVYLFSALCCEETENTEEALTFYRFLLREDPMHPTALSNISLLYKKMGSLKLACGFAEKAIEADPESYNAHHNAASAYFDVFDFEKAKRHAETALKLKPKLRVSLSLLALIYALTEDKAGFESFKAAAVQAGENEEALLNALEVIKEKYNRHLELCAKADEWKKRTEIPAIHFTLDGDSGKSIIGGTINEAPPISNNGEEMKLLAAIFMSELPENNVFPKAGVLRFYITPNDHYGADFDSFELNRQNGFKVLFDKNEDAFITSKTEKSELPFPVNGSFTPRFTFKNDFMSFCDYRFEETFDKLVDSKENELLTKADRFDEDFIEKIYDEHHKLGGCSCFAQEDPRDLNAELNKYDFLLFQLISEYSYNEEKVMFGDAGVCNFFIPKENLLKEDFSDVIYTWDCG